MDRRITSTNNSYDSAGMWGGIDQENLYYLFVAVFIGFQVTLLLGKHGWGLLQAAGLSFVVLVLPVILWIFLLKQGRPPSYDIDLCQTWLDRSFGDHGMVCHWDQMPAHPLHAHTTQEVEESS